MAGDLSRPFPTASGGVDYEVSSIEDGSILMYVGVRTFHLPITEETKCYVFWHQDNLVMFKESHVQLQNHFHRVGG